MRIAKPLFLWKLLYYYYYYSIRDTFLHQHVLSPKHSRGEQNPTLILIGLVLTNEESMIRDLQHVSPLGKSHHQILAFDYMCYTRNCFTGSGLKYSYARG